jgi:hypothetical protein
MAISFNVAIMPMFWIFLAPLLFQGSWHGINLLINMHLITTHTLPFIGSLVNIYFTKGFVMLPRDWKYVLFFGVMYIPANYVGTLEEGAPMYPLADWKNFDFTFFLYFLGAVLESIMFYFFATWLCNKRGFTPPQN